MRNDGRAFFVERGVATGVVAVDVRVDDEIHRVADQVLDGPKQRFGHLGDAAIDQHFAVVA